MLLSRIVRHAEDSLYCCSQGHFKGFRKFIIHNMSDRYGILTLTSGQLCANIANIGHNMERSDKPHSPFRVKMRHCKVMHKITLITGREFSYFLGSTDSWDLHMRLFWGDAGSRLPKPAKLCAGAWKCQVTITGKLMKYWCFWVSSLCSQNAISNWDEGERDASCNVIYN